MGLAVIDSTRIKAFGSCALWLFCEEVHGNNTLMLSCMLRLNIA